MRDVHDVTETRLAGTDAAPARVDPGVASAVVATHVAPAVIDTEVASSVIETEVVPAVIKSEVASVVGDAVTEAFADGGDGFVEAFDAFSQAIRRARGAGSDHPGHLTFSQYALLRTLADRDGARVSDLAAQAAVTPSTATRILDALERRGIVCRTRSAHDRRGVTVTLTAAGRAALRRQDAWMQGRQRAFYAQLPADERELAPDLLLRMSALIDELAAGPQD